MSVWTGPPLVVGHRGGRGYRPEEPGNGSPPDPSWPPENTLLAFERARCEGALAVELDVRPSADGDAIVMHDPTLARMTQFRDTRSIAQLSLGALRAVDLGGGVRVSTLPEVLSWASGSGVAVNVELKHDVPNRLGAVRAAARAVHDVSADVLFSSFDPLMLFMAAILAPRTPRALLTYAEQPLWANVLQLVSRSPFVDALHIERTQALPGVVEVCLRRGLRVGVWTVNDGNEASSLVYRGVRTIITDVPGALVSHFEHR